MIINVEIQVDVNPGYPLVTRAIYYLARLTIERRKQILENDFNIPMTREMEEEVPIMCNLGYAIERKGRNDGRDETLIKSIKNLMETMKWTTQQAMDALKIPVQDQPRYAAKLNKEN